MSTLLSKKRSQRTNKTLIAVTSALLSVMSFNTFAVTTDNIHAKLAFTIKSNSFLTTTTGLTPDQVRNGYDFSSTLNQGAGQTIAVIEAFDNPNAEADFGVFNTTYSLPACTTANGCFKKVYANGTSPIGDISWGIQSSVDVQWAHAIAPQAKILLVETADNSFTNLLKGVNVAVQNGATVVVMGWGSDEFAAETSLDSNFNVSGVEFVAPSGDTGSGVWYPSASPNVIAVGGTTLSVDASGNLTSESAWAGSGGGISLYEPKPDYQTNFPIPNNPSNFRGVPDVAFNADPQTGFAIYDTYGQNGWLVLGGTSAGVAQWAGLIADAKSSTLNKLVGINAKLYSIAKTKYSTTFRDIVTGNNGTCGTLCNAQTGYDYVTGLGVPKANALMIAIVGDNRIPI